MTFILAVHALILTVVVWNVVFLRMKDVDPASGVARPRLSVLVPARNEEQNLQRLLPSLWMQDYPDFEVIVVDDASTDGTWDVLEACEDPRLRAIRSSGPADGWIGKVHALHTAAEAATGQIYLFLDADACLRRADSLTRLVGRLRSCGDRAALSGLPQYTDRGPGLLLTSLVPFTILSTLPLALALRSRRGVLGAINGQCWLIGADDYDALKPHRQVRDEVLEDVMIGRYLKRQGMQVHLRSLRRDVAVAMYTSLADAWRGFRKNAYLLQGGRPWSFLLLGATFWLFFVLAPLFGWPLLASCYLIKTVCDRFAGLPLWVSALAPFAFLGGGLLQIDSALAHWTGTVRWKGRRV